MDNPFNNIIPRENDRLVNEEKLIEISRKIKDKIKERRLILLIGDYGAGKSLYIQRMHELLRTKKELIEFNDSTITILEKKLPLKNILVLKLIQMKSSLTQPNVVKEK